LELRSERDIIERLADAICHRVTRKVIVQLQSMDDALMSGDDSGLANTWDEICVPLQQEMSAFWHVYDKTVRSITSGHVERLTPYEQAAVWLQTQEAEDWLDEDGNEGLRGAYPVHEPEITDYVMETYIYSQAESWSNKNIRTYLGEE